MVQPHRRLWPAAAGSLRLASRPSIRSTALAPAVKEENLSAFRKHLDGGVGLPVQVKVRVQRGATRHWCLQ